MRWALPDGRGTGGCAQTLLEAVEEEEGDVVAEDAVAEEEGFEEFGGGVRVRGAGGGGGEGLADVLDFVGFGAVVEGFDEAVGVEEDAVGGLEGDGGGIFVGEIFAGEEGQAGVKEEGLGGAIMVADGVRVAGGGHGEAARGGVEEGGQGGDEASTEKGVAEFAIDVVEEGGGGIGGGGEAEEGVFEHGGGECGGDAVAGDVGDHEGEDAVGADEGVEEIAADVVEGLVEVAELAAGEGLVFGREEVALDGAGLEEFFFHALMMAQELSGEGGFDVFGLVKHGGTRCLSVGGGGGLGRKKQEARIKKQEEVLTDVN